MNRKYIGYLKMTSPYEFYPEANVSQVKQFHNEQKPKLPPLIATMRNVDLSSGIKDETMKPTLSSRNTNKIKAFTVNSLSNIYKSRKP